MSEFERVWAGERLEYLRGELRAERISSGELIELQSLAEHIASGDTELLEAAGVPEHAPTKIMILQMEVKVPAVTGENEVETALNAALDESGETGLDWGNWEVGALVIADVRREGA
jgi:hypothetical protein